jgi:xanthine/CO dehydrogenase XdhC/CoxF family maturation factor
VQYVAHDEIVAEDVRRDAGCRGSLRSRASPRTSPRSRSLNLGRHLVVRATGTDPPGRTGTLGDPDLDAVVAADARDLLALVKNSTLRYGDSGQRLGEGLEIFVESFAPPPRMLVFGAIDFAAALSTVGAFLGYRVTVCDARVTFAAPAAFPLPTRWSPTGRTTTSDKRPTVASWTPGQCSVYSPTT